MQRQGQLTISHRIVLVIGNSMITRTATLSSNMRWKSHNNKKGIAVPKLNNVSINHKKMKDARNCTSSIPHKDYVWYVMYGQQFNVES